MFRKFVRAASIASLLSTAATTALLVVPSAAIAAEHVSKDVGAALTEAQKLGNSGDFQGALAKVKEAQAASSHSAYDDFMINRFMATISANAKDFQGASPAFDAVIASPEFANMSVDERQNALHDAIIVDQNIQAWQKVVTYSQQLAAMKPLDDVMLAVTAVAYYNLKDNKNALDYAQKSIDAAKAAGKQPEQVASEIVMNAEAATNPAAAEQSLANLAAQTNDPAKWDQIIEYTLGSTTMDSVFAMDLYRLKYITHALKPADAQIIGGLTDQLRYYGDGVAMLENLGSNGKDLQSARAGAAKEKGSLEAELAAARKSGGATALSVGEAFYGYGRYAEAEELGRAAAAKGGSKHPGQAQLLIGMAQVAQGKNADAVQTFNSVSGSPGATKAAHLWSLYAQHQAGGAPAAAAPATHP